MKLKDFLEVLAVGMAFTVGTVKGERWIAYYDGDFEKHDREIPDYLLDRKITNIYPREHRNKEVTCCELKEGLAIIVEGSENGQI